MIDNNNIDDIFKNAFENDRVEPSAQAWGKINKKLFVQNASNAFKDFKVNPSQAVWSSLSKKLFWLSFLRFNVKTFNAYYAGAIVVLSVLLYNGFNYSSSNQDLLSGNTEIIVEENSIIDSENLNSLETVNEEIINNEKTNSKNITESKILDKNSNDKIIETSENVISNKPEIESKINNIEDSFVENNTELNINSEEKYTNDNYSSISEKLISNNSVNETENKINANLNSEINLKPEEGNTNQEKLNNSSINLNSEISETVENNILEQKTENNNISYESQNELAENINIQQSVVIKNNFSNETSEENNSQYLDILISKLATQPIDSLEQIINPDTVAIDAFDNPIIIDKSNLYFDIIASGARNDFSFANFNTDANYGKIIDNATTADYLYSAGARIGSRHKSWLAETGISFTKLNEKFNYDYLSDKIDTSYYYETFDASYTKYDTIMFLNLDDLLATGDTVYSPYVRETWVDATDSTLNAQLDTSKITENLNIRNIYTYVEIPLIIGYQVSKHKFTYSLNGGVITGIFIKSKGSSVSQSNTNDIVDIANSNLPYMKFNYSFVVAAGINYKLNDKFYLLAEPFYRQSINSLFDKNYMYSKKNKAYGATIGLRYIIK